MTHGSLFSGIGGFDLAAEMVGWTNLFHCELNEFVSKVINYHFPNSIHYADITKTDFTIWRGKIDVLSGGFPCQPYSLAGKRLGKDDERHLWPEMLRAIREIRPRWVVGENVYGIVNWNGGMVFEEVCADLEAEGYQVQPYILPACAVGAPHRRDRVWFVAYRHAADTDYPGTNEQMRSQREWSQVNKGWQGQPQFESREDGNDGHAADTDSANSETWSQRTVLGQPNRQKANGYCDVECANQWQNFPSVSPICDGNDGISDRLDGITFSKWRQESIKAYGNAVVPQLVTVIFNTINQYESIQR